MPDVYAVITEVDEAVVDQVADAIEVSAADPQHREMVADYLTDLALGDDARVLEIGCGTGAIARTLAGWPGVGAVLGVDPSPLLLAKARELSAGIANLSFAAGDGRHLSLAAGSFDAVVVHRVLSHVPGPEQVLAETFRVLRAGGRLAVFDGDYATITLATGDPDPLQTCVDAFRPPYITDPWVVRRLAALVHEARVHRRTPAQPRLRPGRRPRLHAEHRRSRGGRARRLGGQAFVTTSVIGRSLGW
jgi:arsenite methyltransferase